MSLAVPGMHGGPGLMGKTRTPLTILVDPSMAEWPEVQALHEAGHVVQVWAPPDGAVYLGPRCWRMTEVLRGYVAVAVKSAQKLVRG